MSRSIRRATIDEASARIDTTGLAFTRAFGLGGRSANAGISRFALSGFRRRLSQSRQESDVDETLAMIQRTACGLSDDVRNLSHELHSGALQYSGLADALKEYCSEFGRHHRLAISVETAGEGIGSLDTDVALCLYRVTQEVLANTAHHARVRAAQVRLARTREGMELDVVDDGVGFDPEQHSGGGRGLRSIRERVGANSAVDGTQ